MVKKLNDCALEQVVSKYDGVQVHGGTGGDGCKCGWMVSVRVVYHGFSKLITTFMNKRRTSVRLRDTIMNMYGVLVDPSSCDITGQSWV